MPDIDIIIKAQDRASGALKDVNSELGKMDGHATGLKGALGTLSGILGEGLRLAAIGAAAALTGLGVAMASSITKAANMEQSVADIRSVFGKTAPSAKELGDAITDLGLDPKLKVDATEAAAAINMLAKNGISWQDIQGGMAKSTVLLANATNDNFATAADVATNAMVNFNKGTGDMTDVINGIIGVTQASKFDINDYALALAQAGGVAGSVGVDFEDFNAMLAATSSSFASGSDAGTSFKTFLQRLVPNTEPAADAMRKLGLFSGLSGKEFDKLSEKMAGVENSISSLDPTSANYNERLAELTKKLAEMRVQLVGGSSAFFDAQGNMESGEVIAGALAEAFGGLSDAERIQAASTIFGTDAMRTALSLADGGADTVLKFKKQIGDVSAEDAAATRMDTLKGSWEIFTGVVDALQTKLGMAFLPILRGVVDWLTKLATEHGPAVIAWFTDLSSAISAFLQEIKNSKDPLATFEDAFGHIIPPSVMTAIDTVVRSIQSFIKVAGDILGPLVSWKDVLIALGIAFTLAAIPAIVAFLAAAAPVVALIAGITAAVALLRHAWEGDWGGIQEKTKATMDYLTTRFGGLLDTLRKFGPDALKEIGAFVTGNETKFTALGAIWDSTKQTAQKLFTDMIKFVTDNLPIWIAKLKEWAKAAWQWIVDVTPTVIAKLGEWGAALWKWITDNAPTWATKLGEFATRTWDWLKNTVIPAVATKLGEWATALWKWITDNAPTWAKKLGEFALNTWDWLKNDVIPKVATRLNEWGTALYKWVTDNAPTWATKLKDWGVKAWEWIRDEAIPNAKTQIGKWWDMLRDYVTTNLPNWKTKLAEWANAAWQWVVDATGKIAGKLTEWWTAVKAWFDANLPKFKTTLALWTDAMKQWVIDATPKTTAELGNWWVAVSAWFLKKGPDFEVGLVQWTTKLVEWVGKAIPGVITGITDLVTGLVNWMIGTGTDKGLGKIGTGLESWITAFKDWISGPNGLITRLVPEWGKLGTSVIDAIININKAINDAKERITVAIATALVFVGVAIVDGIKQGIDSASGGLLTKITDMANAALAAAKVALGIQSPSREFHWIGQMAGQGFVNGMDSQLTAARAKATELAQIASQAAAQTTAQKAANLANAGKDIASVYNANQKAIFDAHKAAVQVSAVQTPSIADIYNAQQKAIFDAHKAAVQMPVVQMPTVQLPTVQMPSLANIYNAHQAEIFNAHKAAVQMPTNKTTNFTVNVQSSGNAVQDIRNQVELYALTFGGA